MEKNDIKKLLYKQNPVAKFLYVRKGNAYYDTTVEDTTLGSVYIQFEVPVNDMGDADFLPIMEAKFLNRWILK
jgi:hypothetical protein